jgi:hypothetical protein
MEPAARAILNVFKQRGLRANFTDFGDAIVWENGGIWDEATRRGVMFLIENDYLVRLCLRVELDKANAGLVLTKRGQRSLETGD